MSKIEDLKRQISDLQNELRLAEQKAFNREEKLNPKDWARADLYTYDIDDKLILDDNPIILYHTGDAVIGLNVCSDEFPVAIPDIVFEMKKWGYPKVTVKKIAKQEAMEYL